jgi:hypothetical protein
MTHKMTTDGLVEEAQRATGLERFDSESFREGLDVLVANLNRNQRSDQAHARFQGAIVKALADRLRVTDALARRPELLDRPIERPLFIFGIPRTGTTLLSNLLACDPARRSPLTWEIEEPVPPPTAAHLHDDPRALAQLARHEAMVKAVPEMMKYYRNTPLYPNECIWFMCHDFKALMWESREKLPEYRNWYFQADLNSTYEYHKRFLQLHQADAPGIWNLKMPSHALWLDTLLAHYPDARLVWTHRDPLTATGSFCSLLTLGPKSSGAEVDYQWIGENCSFQAVEHAERAMDTRDRIGEDRILDVHYADLMRDPIATVRALYASLGDEFTPEAEAAMQAWLDENPQGKFGRHEYKLAQYGLSPETLRPRFERYASRYDVEPEG